MSGYQLFLFGAPRIEVNQEQVAIDTRKALALLAFLILNGEPQSRDTVAAFLWPESGQTSARAALRRTLSTLRRVLDEDMVDFGREVITLKPETGLWCDVTAFRARLDDCKSHNHAEDQVCMRCQAPLTEATEIYRGDFLAGFSLRDSVEFDNWQFLQAEQLRRELSEVLDKLVLIHGALRDYSAALEYARRWLSLDQLNEAAHRTLINLYALNGQRSEALHQYRECVRILDQELGVAPLEETTRLYEDVKENQVTELIIYKPLLGILPEQVSAPSSDLSYPGGDLSPTSGLIPLIGRNQELEQLKRIYESMQQNGFLTVLTGEAGIGKTRLAHEFLSQLQSRGTAILSAQCYAGESNLTFSPLIDLLRQGIKLSGERKWWQGVNPHLLSEVSRLLPEFSEIIPDLPNSQLIDGPGAQSRFYEGICQTLEAMIAGPQPGVLFIDNLEWADESTLDLLAYLTRRLKGRPLFLLVSWGSEPSPATTILEQMLNDAVLQGGGIRLNLSALSPDQAQELIELVVNNDEQLSPVLINRLVEESDGLPIFLMEYLHAIQRGKISKDLGEEPWPVPSGLRSMLRSRLSSLSDTAAQILQAAAVIGRIFDSELLKSTSGRSEEETIQGIEELLSRNLIRGVLAPDDSALATASYDFRHEQIREIVQGDISLARCQLLHRRTAEALEGPGRFDLQSSQRGQIAYHYHQAGLIEKAANYYFLAGRMDRSMHANNDALAHFQKALALGYPQKAELFIELGDLYTLKGDYHRAIRQYEAAAAISESDLLTVIEQRIGQVYLRGGLWDQAAYHFENGLKVLGELVTEEKNALEAKIRADWSLACLRSGNEEQANSLAHEALSLAKRVEDPLALAQVHNLLGVLARSGSQAELALKHLEESLAFARQSESRSAQIAALNNLALAQADLGEYGQAIKTIQAALSDCIVIGDRHLEAAVRNNLADQLRASGDEESAMVQLKEAVTIFAEIGQRVEDWEPEIWKLVAW
jgi:DNA-binding SARP family transcriptional activator/lipopolysaccharide biosynthesis regulator YciM